MNVSERANFFHKLNLSKSLERICHKSLILFQNNLRAKILKKENKTMPEVKTELNLNQSDKTEL